jgi:hypothetical protein
MVQSSTDRLRPVLGERAIHFATGSVTAEASGYKALAHLSQLFAAATGSGAKAYRLHCQTTQGSSGNYYLDASLRCPVS